jgi:hypothetical protein
VKSGHWFSLLAVFGLTVGATSSVMPPINELNIAQVQYGGGGDWYANPSGLPNLLKTIRDRTGLPVAAQPAKLKLTDPNLWNYPYIYITGHGNIKLTEEEVDILRRYLLAGGFLHVDDNFGLDKSFRREIVRVFPDKELVELPMEHPVYHAMYDMPKGLPKVHKHEGGAPQGFGILHEGRLAVFYSFESDLGNGWEDADRYGNPAEVRESAFRMGINLFVYALSQAAAQ